MSHKRAVNSRSVNCRFYKNLIAVAGVAFFVGCGGDPNIGDVSGKITLNGQPLENAFVTLSPTSTEGVGSKTFGKTASDGTYRMIVSENKNGSYVGENLVRIKTGDVKADNSGVIKEVVPAIYNSKSKLLVDVKNGSNIFNFKLESKGEAKVDVEFDGD